MNRITNVSELDAAVKQAEEMLHADSHRILVCAGTGCLAGGSQKIYDRFCEMAKQSEGVKVEFVPEAEDTVIKESCHVGVKKSGCHGFCEMGPLVRIEPYNYIYIKVKEEDCEEIFNETILHGRPVERLMYHKDGIVYRQQEEIPFYKKQTRLVLKTADISMQKISMNILRSVDIRHFVRCYLPWSLRRLFRSSVTPICVDVEAVVSRPDTNGSRLPDRRRRSDMLSAMVMREIRVRSWIEA